MISINGSFLVIFLSPTIFYLILINGFSLILFFFNSGFPYPGNDFTIILLLFNI